MCLMAVKRMTVDYVHEGVCTCVVMGRAADFKRWNYLRRSNNNGKLPRSCVTFCSRELFPVCAWDGVKYTIFPNNCELQVHNCTHKTSKFYRGSPAFSTRRIYDAFPPNTPGKLGLREVMREMRAQWLVSATEGDQEASYPRLVSNSKDRVNVT
uniref:Kazal-like domain-containing protein n=1 Tax=Timema cristinae TaxID=61476 RepID=A0A7R9D1X2_TIMCR|nr:unnamed protein product [Timema cristinae]